MNLQITRSDPEDEEIIGLTESVCPVCLKKIGARRVKSGDHIYLDKTCLKHGSFRTVIWRGLPSFASWHRVKAAEYPKAVFNQVNKGCPFDCGLCPEHRQQSCCVLLEITSRCNLRCPVCFADAGCADRDQALEDIKSQLQLLFDTAGKCNIQLSGGEPTVREDLPEIIKMACSIGYTFVQLNTNGIRLAEESGYAKELKEAGLSAVFMQFDGLRDEIYEQIRGRRLLNVKMKAIDNCSRHHLGVVLVPTLVPGINTGEIGKNT
jgi:uncharacterized radical SAM superfamily Fe-S cluster-containing enzyme